MSVKIWAPWTDDQVKNLNDYQRCDYVHQFTGDGGEILFATKEGWVRREGETQVVQKWAWSGMVNGTTVKVLAGCLPPTQE